ncbi:MAG: 4-hydroxy-tetrahydrodipicolinate reductase [Rickettsiales bacterium]|nr:4-hydroxy-tetrahydrodipicolinate reductase [Rickettsiales bacterium]
MFLAEILENPETILSGAAARKGNAFFGQDTGLLIGVAPTGVAVSDQVESVIKVSDAVIDFTNPETTLEVARLCGLHQTVHVCGTTGLSPAQFTTLHQHSSKTPIIWSANMSIGVNLLLGLVEQVASLLGDETDIEVLEMHHRNKVDAPSGTALALGAAAAQGRKVTLSDVARKSRDGHTGVRPNGEIGFATLRGGDVIGDHTVIFAHAGERIELSHKASNRTIYAKGAVRACVWAKNRKPGLYSMQDVLKA